MKDQLHRVVAKATLPSDAKLGRVRRRLLGQVADPHSSRALLRRVPPVAPEAIARVRERVLSLLTRMRTRRRWPVAAGVALAAAAGVVLVVAIGFGQRDRSKTLESLSEWQVATLDPRTEVRFQGYGAVHSDGRSSEITWEYGTLHVEVEPKSGAEVRVSTREGTVRVVGTVFSVQRDALGTSIEVERGVVEVECATGSSTFLGPDQRAECLPTTAAGLLGRARALADAGTAPSQILPTVETGLARSTDIATAAELTALRIELLGEAGRKDEALDHAEAYLASDNPIRRTQVLRMAARLALELHGCKRARSHLEALAAAAEPRPDDLRDLAECEPGGSARRKGLLRRAADLEDIRP